MMATRVPHYHCSFDWNPFWRDVFREIQDLVDIFYVLHDVRNRAAITGSFLLTEDVLANFQARTVP